MWLRLRVIATASWFFLVVTGAHGANGNETAINGEPTTLVLDSRSPANAWAAAQIDGMLQVFRDQRPNAGPIVEYMDWQPNSSSDQETKLAAYYASKFSNQKIRAVITADAAALGFVLRYHDTLFSTADVVACGIERLEESKRRSWLTAVIQQNDAPGTFRLALQLQPNLKRLLIVDDREGSGSAEKIRIEAACPEESKRVKLDLIDGDATHALFTEVEKLPHKTAILLTRSTIAPRVLEVLSQRSTAPIYGLRAPIHLPGLTAGSLLDGEKHGATAAQIAIRLMNGERATTIPVVSNIPPRVVVDYAQLLRYQLPVANIPAGAEILNQPPTFWQQHGVIIGIASAVILLLGGSMLVLIRQSRRNRATASDLATSLSTLNATFDSTADGVLVVDKDGRVSACNGRFLELWHIPTDLSVDKRDEAFLRHAILQLKDPSAFLARVRELYVQADASSHGELIEFKDGRVFERDSRPLRHGKKTAGRVWSFRDVTSRVRADQERRKTGDQLAQAQKMEALGNLAGGIAHDFNNILTGIIGYVELAKARLPGRHPAADDLDHVLRASERAKDLVRQILTFSRKRAPEKKAITLEPVIRETLKLLRAVVPAAIEIRAELSTEAGTVLADPTQIHQAVLNLATNAVHAMAQNAGQIRVTLQPFEVTPEFALTHSPLRPGGHVCLSVSDTGHGMDSATLKRIFEPFFTTKAPGEGTGLGLAVVQAIIQGHDGLLTVESEVNLGSSFRIYLPLARESQIRNRPEPQETPEGHGEMIMVVDDEAMITEVCRCFLESLNYQVTVAHSPEQALVEFTKNPTAFAGLITDFNMPHMNGLELLRRLRTVRPELPALLCTGYVGSAATENEATDLGVKEILGKPFTRHSLGCALYRTLTTPISAAPHQSN